MMKKLTTTILLTLSIFVFQAQEKQEKISLKSGLKIELKDTENANVYVDGKKFDFSVELIDKEAIAFVTILKEPKTIKEYNLTHDTSYDISKKLVLIATIKNKASDFSEVGIIGYESNEKTSKHVIKIKGHVTKKDVKPLILIDGKKANKEELSLLEVHKIESVSILKGEKAIEKYNAPNGVVLVTTKKN